MQHEIGSPGARSRAGPERGGQHADNRIVFVVEDDAAVRDSLVELLHSADLNVEAFESAHGFLSAFRGRRPACLLLDVRLPGMSGLQLQDRLIESDIDLPILFISGHGDLPMAVEAMKKGAYDFVEKPAGGQDLIDKVRAALAVERNRRHRQAEAADLERRLERLSPREREVLELLAAGKSAKQVAYQLGISPKTAHFHRGRILEKLQAETFAAVVLDLQRLDLL
jgi:RNA polymerase sigma factor (sigma-70 family)